jgi:hypothetical protein
MYATATNSSHWNSGPSQDIILMKPKIDFPQLNNNHQPEKEIHF